MPHSSKHTPIKPPIKQKNQQTFCWFLVILFHGESCAFSDAENIFSIPGDPDLYVCFLS
ncbi:hypothetical protein CHCC15337_0402 [Bacillus paralicheniformis]|nr:hypothetical protein CHCC15337_0402 [Bacillus paralicheniformis]